MARPLILVTGATGTVGMETITQLTAASYPVRALVRNSGKAAKLDRRAEVVIGDLAHPSTLGRAFAGVAKVFVIANGADLERLEANAFEAAKRAGVGHIVKLSGRGVDWPEFAETVLAEWHGESERRLKSLGVEWTILRPCFFASNLLLFNVIAQRGLFLTCR